MRALSGIAILSLAVALCPAAAFASLHVAPGGAGLKDGSSAANALQEILTGNQTGQGGPNGIDAAIASTLGSAIELYKQNAGDLPIDVGTLASSYTTTMSPAGDFANFEIKYDGGPAINPAFLLVKDGNNDPAWYLFDISAWDGVSSLFGEGFWAGRSGSISHVTLYGSVAGSVPEPGTIAIWSVLALSAVVGARKWRQLA